MSGAPAVLERLDSKVGGPARRRVVLILGGVLAIDGADKAALGASAADLERSLSLSHTQLGMLVSVTLLAGAVTTLPMGLLVDRFRRVPLLTGSAVAWSAAIIVSGSADSLEMLIICRVILGALLGAAGPAVASLVGDLVPGRERGRIYGYVVAGELFGAGVGILVAGELTALLSWRFAFWFLGGVGLAVAWALWRLLPEPDRGGQSRESDADRLRAPSGVKPDPRLILRRDPTRLPLRRAVVYVLRIRTTRIVVLASALGYFFFAGVRTFAVVFAEGHYGLTQPPRRS